MNDTDIDCKLSMINAVAEQEDFCCYVGKAYFSGDYAFFDREGVKWYRTLDGFVPQSRESECCWKSDGGFSSGHSFGHIISSYVFAYRIVED